MNTFSVFDYENLSDSLKTDFNKALAMKLSSFMKEIKDDDVLDTTAIEEFVASSGECANAVATVSNLYSSISGGIQVGSGNQLLFNGILNAITESWKSVK